MTLLTQLAERPVPMVEPPEPKQRRGWRRSPRQVKADREARDAAIAEELRQKREQQAARWRSEREELLVKASELPPGVTVVEPSNGRVSHARRA